MTLEDKKWLQRSRLLPLAAVAGLLLLLSFGMLLNPEFTLLSPSPTPVPTATSWPLSERLDSPGYGVNVHMWWDPWAAIRRDWKLVQDAGFTWVKQRLAWLDVEGAAPGAYEWNALDRIVNEAEEAGVKLLLRIDHPPAWAVQAAMADESSTLPVAPETFAGFCSVLASRYQGRVAAYQVWNEPNLAREWGGATPDPAGYVELLKACYVAIKRADAGALVISAGLAPTGSGPPEAIPDEAYLASMYEAGASPYFDLLGLNAPGYKAPPEVSPEEAADPESGYGGASFFCFRHAEEMRDLMVQYGDADKQVAVLEFGWHTNASPEHPDYAWFAVTPEEQADYLVRAFEYAHEHWDPWIGPMFVWNLPDSKWKAVNEEFWWAIADPFWWGFDRNFGTWGGAGVRPAYEALKEMPKP
ncbi:MAG: cellulase family glycosylhydrolase [Anaerolineae bacterium]|nr:cellulase family glycosylhydrolase [Anaerolineae bacterium]